MSADPLIHRSWRESWWISFALGRQMAGIFLDGTRERWRTEDVGKGLVFGIHIGRVDNHVQIKRPDIPLGRRPRECPGSGCRCTNVCGVAVHEGRVDVTPIRKGSPR